MADNYKPLPDRWLNCPRIGALVFDSFVPFKTPLDERYRKHIEKTELFWEPATVLGLCKARKITLGLVIDLTNSRRYYKPEAFTSQGVEYKKIACRGHNESPDDEAVNEFLSVCCKFLEANPEKRIGVHCTHGFNRTGFLICAYAVQIFQCSVEAAVCEFQKARDPGIYKQDYLIDLAKKFGEEDDIPEAAPRPTWGEEPSTPTDETERKRHSKEFMSGIPGVSFLDDEEEASRIQKLAAVACEFRRKGFPGSQPVSMDINNVNNLAKEHHVVSWKADGTRYMLVIAGRDQVYFLDRDNAVFKVDGMTFPHRKDLHDHLSNTVLDGEMVIDLDGNRNVPRYLIYDIVVCGKVDIKKSPFAYRVECINNEIIRTRVNAHQQGIINFDNEPFRVRLKDFFDVTMAEKFYGEKFRKQLSHDIDGLIFQPSEKPYKADRCLYILKWKPPELNTIDFLLRIVRTPGTEGTLPKTEGQLFVGGLNQSYGLLGKVTPEARQLDGKIVECGLKEWTNEKTGAKWIGWKILRERTDKSFPNGYSTAEGVMKSIKSPVTKDYLFTFIRSEAVSNPGWKILRHQEPTKRSGDPFVVPPVPPSRPRQQDSFMSPNGN